MPASATLSPHSPSATGFAPARPDAPQRPTVAAHTARAPDARWDPLVVCAAGYVLVAVARVHQLFSALEALRPATIVGVLALVLFVADRSDARRLQHVFGAPAKCLLLLFVWMVLSTSGALVLGTSVDVVFGNVAKSVAMVFVLAACVRGVRDVDRLVGTYLAGATLYALVVMSRFELGSGDAWRLGRLYYYDANDCATYLVTAMPFGLYVLHAGRSARWRLAAAGALIVLTVAFVRTGSRGGFIALLATAAWIVWRYRAIPLRWRLAAPLLVTLVVGAVASDQYWTQMGTILSDVDYNRTDESGRLQIWRRGIEYMLDDPVFGVGPGNFQAAEGLLSPFARRQQFGIGVRWNAPHNSYVQVGAELGVPGLAMFLTLMATTFASVRRPIQRARAGSRRFDALGAALTASLVGFTVGAYFLSLAYAEMLYVLIAFAIGLQKARAAARSPAVVS